MIYVTGDMHGEIDRMRGASLKKLGRDDTLIICGDFGFVWNEGEKERKLLRWIAGRKYQVAFVDGVHDNLELLEKFPQAPGNRRDHQRYADRYPQRIWYGTKESVI